MNFLDRRFLNFSLSVNSIANEPAANPTVGTQYIVGSDAYGEFDDAYPNQIARYDGSGWKFFTPKAGELEVLNLETSQILQFDGVHWVTVASLGGESGSSSGSSNTIQVVDDIVYGFHDSYNNSPKLTPANLKALRGRPVLCYDGEEIALVFDNVLNSGTLSTANSLSIEFNDGDSFSYAGFGDGKIHLATFDASKWEYTVTSTNLHNGEYIFNKADNAFYCYDATNHKFHKVGGKHSYVVDALIDYVGTTLPNDFNLGYASFVKVENSHILFNYTKQGSSQLTYELDSGFSFANIQSLLADEAGIYSLSSTFDNPCVHIIHDLYDGDSIFNKADGCTYFFRDDGTNKSFVRASIPTIAPVLDILPTENFSEYPTAKGDKFLGIISDGYDLEGAYTYNAVSSNDWGDPADVVNGDRYASSSDHKIYELKIDGDQNIYVIPADIPVGASFLNKADNCHYVYDGTNFINVTLDPENSRFIAPVLDIVHIGDSIDNPSNVNDKFIVVDDSASAPKLYTANGSQWDDGQIITAGSRYASLNNHKIYIFDERCDYTATVDIPVNAIFLNRADNCLYVYDGTNFINVTLDPENSRFIAPVLDIVHIGNSFSWCNPSNENDKLIIFYNSSDTPEIYTADGSEWDRFSGQFITAGSRYASLDNHKIYIFDERGDYTLIVDIPVNAIFLNRADNCLYVYNGSTFIKTGNSGNSSSSGSSGSHSESSEHIAPVLSIIQTASSLPASCAAGDSLLNTSDAKIYTATAANTWNSGVLTANGARYASSTDHKIYSSNGSALSDEAVPTGGTFLNKADNFLYVYDGANFIKASNNSASAVPVFVTESHSLTAAEVTAKSFSLSNSIASGQESNTLLFVSGIAQIVGTDFAASGNSISWNSKGLDSIGLATGDTFLVQYIRA